MKHFKFDDYACIGDTSQIEREGFTITARVVSDEDTTPDDFECYDNDQLEAWKRDEWFYCGIVVSASKNGVILDDHCASLWALEVNIGPSNDHLAEYATEAIDTAILCGKDTIASLTS